MNASKLALGALAAVAIGAAGVAHAARVGVYIGPGYPYYYPVAPAPYYYPPPVVAVPVAPPPPPEYIEQGQAQEGPDANDGGLWYYCDASKHYYPYVKTCKSGWRSVPARPQ
ncbi:hypothetical protein [Burkholderia ubonensis]|uniref:Lipoprotein n=1 Tax=Burkholderia ubonensis subsp. mesacidophila TaxID=265293 RepID=A0A2A4FBY6_9BURK|nr:hypothetical protein [Burkholderia ubonensis]PCE29859.1 hypothetical protein BZL54_23915 [Burkholderia ubonensis subsp. mesacidophila]